MRAFPVRLPSGARYWTVLDGDLKVVPVADSFLRHVRFGRDGAESTTRSYAFSIALFLRWCLRSGRAWQAGVEQIGLFMTWLAHAVPAASGADGGAVMAGPGAVPARGARRINAVLTAVRGMTVHAVAEGPQTGTWCRCCMRSRTTGTCPPRRARGTAGCRGGCGPGIVCASRSRRSPGRRTLISPRCWARACRRGTG